MKKRLFVFLLALLLSAVPVFAAAGIYVCDVAGALADGERQALETRADGISRAYGCGVYIAAVEDYGDYGSSIEEAAETIYRANGFGLYDDASGILLLLSIPGRKYDVYANGFGTYALGNSGRDAIAGAVLDSLRENDWYGGFSGYLDACESLLERAAAEYESGGTRAPLGAYLIAGLMAGVIVALIVCLVLWAKMKSVQKAAAAQFYAVPGSLDIYESSDTFSHVTETRVKVESDANRSGGGDRPSGGGSHGGGSF